MLPDTPENLQQIIGIYKAYAMPMDFYWRDLLYIPEQVFLNPLPAFKYFLSQEYLDRPNSYAGDQSQLRILKYHVIGEAHTREALCTQAEWESLEGAPLPVRRQEPFELKNATVISADIVCANGVVHAIDRVLLPG